jgi:TRAP-type mannitol/chloroaromatic compound transport system substrate-binding protein
MKRRRVLAGGATIAAGTALAAPAIAQGIRQLRMVTDWPAASPGPHDSSRRLAQTIAEVTGGRIRIEVFAAGELVRSFETFDAVGAGVAELYHSYEGYFASKSPGFSFFATMPFGFTADELYAWVRHGGGQALWDELSGQFNVKPLLSGSTGCQMGGWFTREIASAGAFRGLRYRMAGPGAEVLRRLGAVVVSLPGGEITSALQSGAIDATEWIGPWLDTAMGLHKSAKYYYYPGFHEPGAGWSLGINRGVWDSLPAGDRRIIEAVAAAEYLVTLSEFNAANAAALRTLREDSSIRIMKFDDALLKELHRLSMEVVAEAGAADGTSRRIHASYQAFRASAMAWGDLAERAFLNGRALG